MYVGCKVYAGECTVYVGCIVWGAGVGVWCKAFMGHWISLLGHQRALDVVCEVWKTSDAGLNGTLDVLIEWGFVCLS